MRLTRPVEWVSDKKFIVDGLEFGSDLGSYTEQTTPDRVVILKDSRLLQQYLDFLAPHEIGNILEFGIWQGGSPLFYGLASDARKIVAIDHLNRGPAPPGAARDPALAMDYQNPALEQIIKHHGMRQRVRLHFGVSQDDRTAVTAVMDKEFGKTPIDLIIDDASHYYALSRKSFEIGFPRLREGGFYIIEDWQWAHSQAYEHNKEFGDKPALSNLIFELLIAYGGSPDLFWNVVVRDWFVAIQRGARPLTGDFRLDDLMRMRGKKLTLI